MTHQDDLAKFKASMKIGYLEWHDGIGYDLDSLSRLTGEDLRAAENLLIARNLADWRDVEALDQIGSPRSVAELSKGVRSNDLWVRAAALKRLMIRGALSNEAIDAALV